MTTIGDDQQKQYFNFHIADQKKNINVRIRGNMKETEVNQKIQEVLKGVDLNQHIKITISKGKNDEITATRKIFQIKENKWITDTKTEGVKHTAGTLQKIAIQTEKINAIKPDKINTSVRRGALHTLMSPFMALKRMITGKKRQKNAFLDEAQCRNFSGFVSLLKTANTLTKNTIANSVHIGKKIEDAFKSKKSLNPVIEEIKTLVKNNNLPLAIPLGYYNANGEFSPLLLVIESKNNDNYSLKLLGSDAHEPREITYNVSKGSLQLEKILEPLLHMTRPPQENIQSAGKKIAVAIDTKNSQHEEIATTEKSPFEAIHQFVKNITNDTNPEIIQNAFEKHNKQHLVATLLHQVSPETPLAHKGCFMLEVIAEHISRHMKQIGSFSDKQQVAILKTLCEEYKEAAAILKKTCGIHDEDIEKLPQFKHVANIIKQAEQRLKSLETHIKGAKDRDFKTGNTGSDCTVASSTPTTISNKQSVDISALKNFEAKPNIQNLSQVNKQLDSLVDAQQYDDVIEQATRILASLPIPHKDSWKDVSSEDQKKWQEAIHDTVKCLWEAKIKRGDSYVTPEETIHLGIAQATIEYFIRAKSKQIEKTIIRECGVSEEELQNLANRYSENKQAFKNKVTGKISNEDIADYLAGLYIFTNKAHKALQSEDKCIVAYDPQLQEKALSLQEFYEEGSGPSSTSLHTVKNDYSNRLAECVTSKPTENNRKSNATSEQLPPAIQLLRNMQIMQACIITPEQIVKPYFPHWTEETKFNDTLIKQVEKNHPKLIKGSAGFTEQKCRQFQNHMLQEYRSMGRLRIEVNPLEEKISITDGSKKLHCAKTSFKNPTRSTANVGEISPDLAGAVIVPGEKPLDTKNLSQEQLESLGFNNYNNIKEYNENSWVGCAQASENPKAFYALYTMRPMQNGKIDPSSVMNALQFLEDYPELLSREDIRRYLDMVIFRPPQLLERLKDPACTEGLKIQLTKIKEAIDTAIQQDQPTIAFYLGHVLTNIQSLMKTAVDTDYIQNITKAFEKINLTQVTTQDVEIATYFLDAMRLKSAHTDLEKKLIQQAYKLLKATPEGINIVMLQRTGIAWVENRKDLMPTENLPSNITGVKTAVLQKISQHKDAVRVFEGRTLQGVITRNDADYIIYECDVEGKKFRLEFNKTNENLIIQQKIDDTWYSYCHAASKNSQPDHTDAIIVKYNVWIDTKDNTKGVILCGNQVTWQEKERLGITVSKERKIQLLSYKNKELVFDPKGEKIRWLSCFDPSRILVAKNEKGVVDSIYILGSELEFTKQDGKWMCAGKEWIDSTQYTKSQLQTGTQGILKAIGNFADDTTIICKGTDEDEIYLIPNTITNEGTSVNKPGVGSVIWPPISIKIANNNITTSAAGFLYLAQLSIRENNMKEALSYLEKASTCSLKEEEKALFESMEQGIDTLPEKTERQISCKLKASLLVAKMKRLYPSYEEGVIPNHTLYVSEAQKTVRLHMTYEASIQRVQKLHPFLVDELKLNKNELYEYNNVKEQALISTVGVLTGENFVFTKPDFSEIQTLGVYLAAYVDSSNKQPSSFPVAADISLLTHFAHFYQQAVNKKISQEQVKLLLQPIPSHYDPQLRHAIDIARRMIYTVVIGEKKEKTLEPKKDSEEEIQINNIDDLQKNLLIMNKLMPEKSIKTPPSKLAMLSQAKNLLKAAAIPLAIVRFLSEDIECYSNLPQPTSSSKIVSKDTIEQDTSIDTETKKILLQAFSENETKISEAQLVEHIKKNNIYKKHIEALLEKRHDERQKSSESSPLPTPPNTNPKASTAEIKNFNSHFTKLNNQQITGDLRLQPPPKTNTNLEKVHERETELQNLGIQNAEKEFTTEINNRFTLEKNKLKTDVQKKIDGLNTLENEKIEAIYTKIKACKKTAPLIREMVHKRGNNKEVLVAAVLDIYQKQGGTGDKELDKEITNFLFIGIEKKQLEQAQKKLDRYTNIQNIFIEFTTTPTNKWPDKIRTMLQNKENDKEVLQTVLLAVCKTQKMPLPEDVKKILFIGIEKKQLEEIEKKLDTYKKNDEIVATEITNHLTVASDYMRYKTKDESLLRKILVTEYRHGIVLRKGQLDAIDTIVEKPNSLVQLRMGMGKTSYILPIVMQVLAEQKGKLPIAVVPNELFQMNRQDMDRATRELFEQAAYEFDFNDTVLSNTTLLAKELDRLYEIKQNKGYIITTIEQIAKLEHAITQCDEKIFQGKLKVEDLNELQIIRKRLCQIKELLCSKETQFFCDEADDVLAITKEINVASEKSGIPDKAIFTAGKELLLKIMNEDHSANPKLAILKQAIKNGTHASLSETILQGAIDELKESEQDPIKKRMLENALKGVLQRNPDVDFGIDSEIGCRVVPRVEKKESKNTRFGNEDELVLYNILQYIITGPTEKFLLTALESMNFREPEKYKDLATKANVEPTDTKEEALTKISNYILESKNIDQRMHILEKYVYENELIQISRVQFVMNVQDIFRGKQIGGTSGTLAPDSLPDSFSVDITDEEARKVEGETYVKLAQGYTQGFDSPLEEVHDNKIIETLGDKLQDTTFTAVVNMGLSIEGKNAQEIVMSLHQKCKRPFVFIDPVTRIPHVLIDGKISTFSGKMPDNAVVFYDPEDKRGTDLQIPAGKMLFLPGPTTTREQFCQGLWRARGLGFRHQAVALVPTSIANRIRVNPNDKITLGQLIADIQMKTVEQQAQKNVKAEFCHIKGIASTGLRNILHDPNITSEDAKTLYALGRKYWVQSKEANLSYQETTQIDVIDRLQEECQNYRNELNEIRKQFEPNSDIDTKINELINDLDKKSEKYTKEAEKYRKVLPATIANTPNLSEGTQATELVNQQQQQQQQQQQNQNVQASVQTGNSTPVEEPKLIQLSDRENYKTPIAFSPIAKELYNRQSPPRDLSALRLLYALNSDGQVCLRIISKREHAALEHESKDFLKQENRNFPNHCFRIYAFTKDFVEANEGALTPINIQGKNDDNVAIQPWEIKVIQLLLEKGPNTKYQGHDAIVYRDKHRPKIDIQSVTNLLGQKNMKEEFEKNPYAGSDWGAKGEKERDTISKRNKLSKEELEIRDPQEQSPKSTSTAPVSNTTPQTQPQQTLPKKVEAPKDIPKSPEKEKKLSPQPVNELTQNRRISQKQESTETDKKTVDIFEQAKKDNTSLFTDEDIQEALGTNNITPKKTQGPISFLLGKIFGKKKK